MAQTMVFYNNLSQNRKSSRYHVCITEDLYTYLTTAGNGYSTSTLSEEVLVLPGLITIATPQQGRAHPGRGVW